MTMTSKERWLAAVRMQPVDRLPFWPKLGGAYLAAQPAPWRDMPPDQVHRAIGSDGHVSVPPCFRQTHREGRFEEQLEPGVATTMRYVMPRGELRAVWHYDAPSASWHPVEYPVKRREDIALMAAWWRDIEVREARGPGAEPLPLPGRDEYLRACRSASQGGPARTKHPVR